MDTSKLDRQGLIGLRDVVDLGLCLWGTAFVDFVDGVLDTPLSLLVQFYKAIIQRREIWETRLVLM